MKNNLVAIDSCVFFKMLGPCQVYKNYGEDGFRSFERAAQRRINQSLEEIRNLIPEQFFVKGLSIEQVHFNFSQWVNSKTGEGMRERLVNKKKGVTYIQNGELKTRFLTPEQIAEIDKQIAEFDKFSRIKQQENAIFNELKNQLDTYAAITLFRRILKGEVTVTLPTMVAREVKNHVETEENKNKPHHKTFDPVHVYDLLKLCNITIIEDETLKQKIKDVAEEYRVRRAMQWDKNSLNEYGDSQIMAECSILGLVLLSFNEKDFIINKKVSQFNSVRRAKIAEIDEDLGLVGGKALSPTDYLQDNYDYVALSDEYKLTFVEEEDKQSHFDSLNQ